MIFIVFQYHTIYSVTENNYQDKICHISDTGIRRIIQVYLTTSLWIQTGNEPIEAEKNTRTGNEAVRVPFTRFYRIKSSLPSASV